MGPSQRVLGANCSRFTNTWSPISRVFSIELEGISKACTMKVIMNRPVTSTAARDARNSTVVSRGFSACMSSLLTARLATRFFPVSWANPPLVHYSKCPIPASELKQMADRVGEVIKFITRRGRNWHVTLCTPYRPINQQRPPDNIFPRNEAPIAAVQAFVPVISEHEIVPLRNYKFAIFHQFLHLQPPSPLQTRNWNVHPGELVSKNIMHLGAVTHVRFCQRSAVHVHSSIDEAHAISRNSNHALY